MTIEQLYKIFEQYPSVETDTRKLKTGDIFFALKGENFNGNSFTKKALESGAVYAVIDDKEFYINDNTILVDDVLKTLQELAKYHRKQFTIPFLAITGSNGKTTTKELIHAVLSSTLKTYTTEGNLNNHIGIPLTILRIKKDAHIAVIEMGANHQKEIASYCEFTLPTHGLITNCGKAHLEGFGGVEGVKKGKGELFDYLRSNNGTAFIMSDYDYLLEMSNGIQKQITYGISDAEITGVLISADPFIAVEITKGADIAKIQTRLVGNYNLPNVLAAVAVGKHFNIPEKAIKTSIENYHPSNSRSQMIEKGTNKIILDAYNANPSSMKLAIENFASLNANKKILVLGAMAELGNESIEEHKSIIKLIQQYKWDNVLLVGGDFLKLQHPYLSFSNAEEAKACLQKLQMENSYFLIKGSRSIKLEKILES